VGARFRRNTEATDVESRERSSSQVERPQYTDSLPLQDEWGGLEILGILKRYWPTLLFATCLGVAAAAILSKIQPPIYRSRVAIEVQTLNDTFLDLHNVYPAVAPGMDAIGVLQTQADIFQQDALFQQTARALHLETWPEYQGSRSIVERMRENVRVEPSRNSRILGIVCDAQDPARAAQLCNSFAEAGIDQAVERRLRSARETYESLQPRLQELRANLGPADASHAAKGSRRDVYERFYDTLVEKAGEAWIASRVPQTNMRVIGAAEPANRPYKPNLPLNMAIGTAAGLLLGVGYIMLRADNRTVLREPGEVSRHLNVPELGVIPRVKRLAPASDWDAATLSESFRTTSVSIVSGARRLERCRSLVVTSAWPMEGRTTVVHHLGKALAETSDKVLLIDADTRRPGLHKLFDEANSWGLTDVLREPNAIDQLPVEAIVKKTSVPHVYLLPSGACTESVFGLLSTERMARIWNRFQETFDYILVDAPPCLEFADARMLAHYTSELVLVVRANHTHRKAAQAAIDRVRQDGIQTIGVVLNQWDRQRSFVQYPRSGDGWLGGVL
jgi:capsular exopolysaccharide synthesis family protein